MDFVVAFLLAASQPIEMEVSDCSDGKLFSGTRIELAKGDVCLSTYPKSATRFRNIRLVGNVVCGEVSVPNVRADALYPFAQFAWHDGRNWAIPFYDSYRISRNGLRRAEVSLQNDIDRASRRGSTLLVADGKMRLAEFKSNLAELLASCAAEPSGI